MLLRLSPWIVSSFLVTHSLSPPVFLYTSASFHVPYGISTRPVYRRFIPPVTPRNLTFRANLAGWEPFSALWGNKKATPLSAKPLKRHLKSLFLPPSSFKNRRNNTPPPKKPVLAPWPPNPCTASLYAIPPPFQPISPFRYRCFPCHRRIYPHIPLPDARSLASSFSRIHPSTPG